MADSKVFASKNQQNERFSICKSCDKYFFGMCKVCGCVLRAKVKLKPQTCPLSKWDEVDEKFKNEP